MVEQELIKDVIRSTVPFFIGRIAGIELQIAHCILNDNLNHGHIAELENNAGIKVTNHTSVLQYADQLIAAYEHSTIIAEWDGPVYAITGKGQELIRRKVPDVPRIHARNLEPYYYHDSWMSEMKGKRILIIHPFALEDRVAELSNIFPDREWFNSCTFTFFKPPVTLAGNHGGKDWQEHYGECIGRLSTVTEYDIALVAAGGYGMLIADYIYTEQKKSVMYIGGALQIFFGVIGKRWFDNKEILGMMNDSWVRPDKKDKPVNFGAVEKGCYW